jgi:prepilin-type N-terminal cleavage/methylation domain-containing protein
MSPARPRRRAFTLTELVVVLAIGATLAGLVLCGVLKARATAVRLQCQNNLRQIGLALHGYHDAHLAFPPAFSTGSQRYLSWMARILPYAEQDALWQQAEAAYRATDWPWASTHPGGTVVRLFVCPADPAAQDARSLTLYNPNPASTHHGEVTVTVAFTSYLGNAGTDLRARDGVFAADAPVRLAQLTDGTSTTLLAGERPPSADRALGWWYAGPGQQLTGSADVVLGAAERNVTRPDCPPGPYAFGPGRSDDPCAAFHYWSLHGGGGTFLLGDGAARFLPYSASGILPALATRQGGEPVSLE